MTPGGECSGAPYGVRVRWAVASATLLIALVGGGGARARAAGKPGEARAQAKAAVAQAQVDYQLGRFEAALEGYRRAYELVQLPVLLFDMGQCHRNLGNVERAKFFFEGYLRDETRMDPERRHVVEDLIAESTATLDRQRAAAAAAATAKAAAAAKRRPPARPKIRLEAVDDTAPAGLGLRAAAPESSPGDRSIFGHWWFWTALGALALAGGAAYYVTGEPRLSPPTGTVGTLDRSK
jgi:hypothetical protein